MRSILLIFVICAVAAAGGFLAYRHFAQPDDIAGKPLPAGIQMNDLDGKPHKLDDYRGKLLLINFWATWCGPCLHEIPELVKLQTQYGARGLQIVGPAVDDPDAVRAMLGTLGINYPVLVTTAPEDMIKTMEQLDNPVGGLPFSLLIGADGVIIKRQIGEFSAAELTQLVESQLPK
ncbi:MAG: TlpA family protein disulfide reductase [Nevskia sp.]|nr:TlpA family protein disulfide reductase [Nevskia sp.]